MLWNNRLKRQISRLKYWRIMQNAEFANSTQITIFYIQDMFRSVFITSTKPQITQEHIESHQRSNCLVFLSFLRVLKRGRWGKEECTIVFILVHSIAKLYPVFQFKSFTNQTPRLNFWTQSTQDFWLPHKSRTSTYKNHTYRLEITSGKPSRGTRTSKPDGGCP